MADASVENRDSPTDDAYVQVGQNLRRLRLSRGLTQAQAARIIAVSAQQYQKYEDAQSKCSLNYLIALADYYGVTVNDILPEQHRAEAPARAVSATQPQDEIASEADLLARLVSAFVQLESVNEKLRFVQLAEAVVSASSRQGS